MIFNFLWQLIEKISSIDCFPQTVYIEENQFAKTLFEAAEKEIQSGA